jgi:hypothetical protein
MTSELVSRGKERELLSISPWPLGQTIMPTDIFICVLQCWPGLRVTFMQYGDMWRRQRKILHQLTSPKAAASYEPIQDIESTSLLVDLLEKPKGFWGHGQRCVAPLFLISLLLSDDGLSRFFRYAGSTIMQVAFNKRAITEQDPAITEVRFPYSVHRTESHRWCILIDASSERGHDKDSRRRSIYRFADLLPCHLTFTKLTT